MSQLEASTSRPEGRLSSALLPWTSLEVGSELAPVHAAESSSTVESDHLMEDLPFRYCGEVLQDNERLVVQLRVVGQGIQGWSGGLQVHYVVELDQCRI